MKQEWKDWFIDQLSTKTGGYDWKDRKYSFTNLHIDNVPFHEELKEYITSLDSITKNTQWEMYHIHQWNTGDYFDEHVDMSFHRKWTYICELKSSKCNTSLIVNGTPMKEGIFDNTTLHSLPKIKEGVRISLTVFGSKSKSII